MPRFRSSLALALCAAAATGCAFEDGQPWGRVDVELSAAAPTDFRTADGAAIELDDVEITVRVVELFAGDEAAAAFDPSNPPDGCTFCHSGHCHCGDALVDYETLAARASGGGDATPVQAVYGEGPTTLGSDGARVTGVLPTRPGA